MLSAQQGGMSLVVTVERYELLELVLSTYGIAHPPRLSVREAATIAISALAND
jgi:hypothetical protein